MTRGYELWGAGMALFVVLVAGCNPSAPETISFYAAAGLRDAVDPLCAEFTKTTGVEVRVDYAGSGIVLTRVQCDAQADLFMPADRWYVDKLRTSTDLVAVTVPVAKLTPVLIVFKGNPHGIKTLEDLTQSHVKTALGNPEACQIGRLSRHILDRLGLLWNAVSDKESLTVNELAVWVKMKAVDAAVVWGSTAVTVADSVEVIAFEVLPDEVSRVDCVLMSTAPNPTAAKAFMDFMVSPSGVHIFEKAGFTGAVK